MGDMVDLTDSRMLTFEQCHTPLPTATLTMVYIDLMGDERQEEADDKRLLEGFTLLEDKGVDLLNGRYAFGFRHSDGSIAIKSSDPEMGERLTELLSR